MPVKLRTFMAVVALSAGAAHADSVHGTWSAPGTWPLIAVHAVLTIDGRVLSYGTNGVGKQTGLFIYDVWDPASGSAGAGHTTLPNTTNTDLFCSSQVILPRSGNILITGGDRFVDNRTTNIGNTDGNIFSPADNSLVRSGNMSRERWYGSTISLINGDTYTQGGIGGEDRPEVRDGVTGEFRVLTGADTNPFVHYYPRNFVAPDGRVFGFDTSGRTYYVNTTGNGSITPGARILGTTTWTSTPVMFRPGLILQFGGVSRNAYIIDINGAAPTVSTTQQLSTARQWVNGTVLADGKVLATGGSVVENELSGVNNIAEIWNPDTGLWTQGAPGQNARLYHSTALLLPDARVLVAGGGAPGPLVNLNAEIYTPPYLYEGAVLAARPAITSDPGPISLDEVFTFGVTGPNPITRVTMVKTGSVTHSFNMDQRFMEVPFTVSGGVVTAQAPATPGMAPPGYYMLFVVDSHGVPSVARIVRMNILDETDPPPTQFTLLPLAPTALAVAGGTANFTASATNGVDVQYSWFFDDGTPPSAPSTSPSISHVFAQPGVYYVTVTATRAGNTTQSQTITQRVHLPLTAARPTASTNMIFEPRGTGRFWVANQDNDSVSVFDAVTNQRLTEIAVGARPRSLAIAPDGRIWVVNKLDNSISVIKPSTLAVVRTSVLPFASQPFGLAFAPGGAAAYVVLEGSGLLLKLDPISGAQLGSVAVGRNPRHVSVASNGSTVYVSRFISPPLPGESTDQVDPNGGGGEVVVVNGTSMSVTATVRLHVSTLPDSENQGGGIPNYLGAPVISPDGVTAWVPSKQDNVLRGTLRSQQNLDFQNTVRAISSRINLGSRTEDEAARIDHDNSSVASAAVFDQQGVYLFVALETSREVAVVDAHGGWEIFRVNVGRAPQGLALSADGTRLYVNNFMDRSVTVLDLTQLLSRGDTTLAALATPSAVATDKLSAQVLNGKRLFYDARDVRLAKERYMSCASCHNDGGHDGRVWDLTGLGEGVRNTVALQGRGGAQGPLHWSGNFDEVHDFEGQIRDLAAGTGLMSDAAFTAGTRSEPLGDPKAGFSADLDALAAYVSSLTTFARSPKRSTAGNLTTAAQAGKTVFASANCAQCHSGAGFTDSALNNLHDIGTLRPASGMRLGAPLTGIDTPTLRDVWATAPYLHNGSAATLTAAVQAHNGVNLNATDLANLVSYVEQIGSQEPGPVPPGDSIAPTVPPNFAVANSNGFPRLTWGAATDNVGVTGYAIYRSTNGTLGAELTRVTVRNYTDLAATEGVTYTYAVKAYDAAGNLGAATPLVSKLAYKAPTAPATLTATLQSGDPRLVWSAATDNVGVVEYSIHRSTTSGAMGPEIARTAGTIWVDTTSAAGKTYTYAVKAYDAAGYASGRSPFATITAQ